MNDVTTQVIVSPEIQAQYPDLIKMILKTESMDNKERQYWVDLLPIMTPEQIQNLFDILDNERKKLAEIDSYYSKKVNEIELEEKAEKLNEERTNKMYELKSAEKTQEESDLELERQLLEELENL